jgi:glycosyltransferase involved in cell wall biosynthesis
MKVSVIGARAFPAAFVGTSGVEKYVYEVVMRLIPKKVYFHIYTRSQYQNNFKFKNKQVTVVPLRTVRQKILEALIASCISSIFSLRDGSDVVWYNGIGPAIFAWIPKLAGKKVIITIHSLDWLRTKWSKLEGFLFRWAVTVVFLQKYTLISVSKKVSTKIYEQFKRVVPVAVSGFEKVAKVSNVIATEILAQHSLKSDEYLLYVGRFVPEKRLEWLLNVFTSISTRNKNLKLVIAGGGSYTTNYISLLQQRFIHPRIIWLPYTFGNEKIVLLQNAAALVIPSELEGLPIVALEMISQKGKVVIAKSCIDEELQRFSNVITFTTNSYYSFAKAVVTALIEKGNIPNTPQVVKRKFSWKSTAEIYYNLFSSK